MVEFQSREITGVSLTAPAFVMPGAKATVEAEKTTTADIKLKKTHNLASQLTNAEWMMSVPGPEDQKALLLNCTDNGPLAAMALATSRATSSTLPGEVNLLIKPSA